MQCPVRGVDRISYLPKKVLCHILSFLPTKNAVGTSILSSNWRFLWGSISALDFDDTLLFDHYKGGVYGIGGLKFIDFVDRVLMRTSKSSIHKFRLHCSRRHRFHLDSWIDNALKRKVRELDLSIDWVKGYNLSLSPFASENLVVLKLGRNLSLNISGTYCFPRLKIFHLDAIEFSGSSSTKNLFSSCPVLEELIMKECKLNGITNLHVSSPSLKSLTMDFLSHYRYDDYYYYESDEEYADFWAGNSNACSDYKIVVDAPKLEDLKYKDYVASGYSFMNLHSLVRSKIHVVLSDQGTKPNIPSSRVKILRGIATTKFLSLCETSVKIFARVRAEHIPMFNNLTELRLRCNEQCGSLLLKLLRNSPNLEVLVLGKENARSNQRDLDKLVWKPPPNVPQCLLQQLKTVRILGFNGQENAVKFMTYLLKNGNVSIESKP